MNLKTFLLSLFTGLLYLTSFGATGAADCAPGQANDYRKQLLVTGFPLRHPQQSAWGALRDMEVRLPQWIAARINRSGEHTALDHSHTQLNNLELHGRQYGDQIYRNRQQLEQLDFPDLQFALIGVIESIAAGSDKIYTRYQRFSRRMAGLLSPRLRQPRHFAMTLELVDLYRGELIWQKRWVRDGNWSRKASERTGVASPKFWQTDYGKEVENALEDAVEQILAVMACQPLVTRLERAERDRIAVSQHALRQIRSGDALKLYVPKYAEAKHAPRPTKVVQSNIGPAGLTISGEGFYRFRAGDLVQVN